MTGLTGLLKGALSGIVLQHLASGETYGYEITEYLKQLGFSEIAEGTVYTVLVRLEKLNLVEAERRRSLVGPPRKFYRLNDAGRAYLAEFWTKWDFLADKMSQIKEG